MQKLKTNLSPLIFFLILLNLLFTRPFVGLKIFNHLLGEFIVLFGYLLMFLITFYNFRRNLSKELRLISIIFMYFLLQLLFTQANLMNTYTYKSASFIAMTSFFYVGINFSHDNEYVKKLSKLLPALLPAVYLLGSGNYPEFLRSFFIKYSDKFDYIKASDVLMVILVATFYSSVFNGKKNDLFLFIVIPAFLPLLLYLSRGSFVALVVFLMMEIFSNKKQLFKNFSRTSLLVFLSIIIFVISTLNIYGNLNFDKSNSTINQELEKTQTELIQENLIDLIERRNTIGVIFSLYFEDGVVKSTDGTLNWRLDIWQDLLSDMRYSKNSIFGYGYNEILPVMNDPSEPGRMGRDGMNENIHNYFLNVYARGGVLLLMMFTILHYLFVREWKNLNGDYRLVNFIVPLLIASFFDITMEGVQFPLNYYFFVGTFLALKK